MENSFWIPTVISIGSIIWNFFQSKKILKLEAETEQRNLIHRVQFEKEFNVYTDLWAKLIDLRYATTSLRPAADFRDTNKTDEEIKNERLKDQWAKLVAVIDTFEKNKPFYSTDVYSEIESLIYLSKIEAVDYRHGKQDAEYWGKAQKNISLIIDSMDKIATLIRKRIAIVEVLN